MAIPAILAQNQFETKDTAVSAKQTIFRNDAYLLVYYAQYDKSGEKAENYKKAIDVATEMQSLYPDATSDENKYATGIKTQLQKALDNYNKPNSTGTTKPATKPGKP